MKAVWKHNRDREEKKKGRFLQLVYKGTLCLYKDLITVRYIDANQDQTTGSSGSYRDYFTYYDYYLFNDSVGLQQVVPDNESQNVKELLKKFEVNELFLLTLPDDMKFKEIAKTLQAYDEWLLEIQP